MVSLDSKLAETFPKPPLVAYKRRPNLRDKLIRAKLPKPASRPKRASKGMKKCFKFGKGCPVCPFVDQFSLIKSSQTNVSVQINTSVNCQDENIIYCISCKQCTLQYIGTTERSFQKRISEHRDYIKFKDLSQPCGRHFNQRGHSLSDMSATVMEKVFSSDKLLREERESMWIRKFDSEHKGLNRES